MIRQALHRCHAFVSSRRNLFTFLASETLARIFVCTLYGVLAVMASMYVGEAAAGVFLGIMGGIQLFVDYAAGYLSDKYGSKIPLLIYNSAFVVSGVLLALSIDAFWAVVAIGIISHIGWGMRIVQTYILRTIDAHEGGLLFGISDQLFGVSYFISSFLIPWCIVAQWYQELGVILIVIGCLNFIVTSSLPSDVEFLISEDKVFILYEPIIITHFFWLGLLCLKVISLEQYGLFCHFRLFINPLHGLQV
jgi:MFS family permease